MSVNVVIVMTMFLGRPFATGFPQGHTLLVWLAAMVT
jgi:hypothetical protein